MFSVSARFRLAIGFVALIALTAAVWMLLTNSSQLSPAYHPVALARQEIVAAPPASSGAASHAASPLDATTYHLNIVGGYPDHSFHPSQSIRRDEMAGIVYKGINTLPLPYHHLTSSLPNSSNSPPQTPIQEPCCWV